jgi:Ca2+-binding EF-hand superfamily protein
MKQGFVRLSVPAIALIALALFPATSFAAKKKGQPRDPEKMAAHVIKTNDKDGDGAVQKTEFKGKAKRFDRLDKNSDGKLDRAELKTAAENRPKNSGTRGKRKGKSAEAV